jgi:hypothetical protein
MVNVVVVVVAAVAVIDIVEKVSILSTFLRTNFSYEHCFGSFF